MVITKSSSNSYSVLFKSFMTQFSKKIILCVLCRCGFTAIFSSDLWFNQKPSEVEEVIQQKKLRTHELHRSIWIRLAIMNYKESDEYHFWKGALLCWWCQILTCKKVSLLWLNPKCMNLSLHFLSSFSSNRIIAWREYRNLIRKDHITYHVKNSTANRT